MRGRQPAEFTRQRERQIRVRQIEMGEARFHGNPAAGAGAHGGRVAGHDEDFHMRHARHHLRAEFRHFEPSRSAM
ncbi:MAG: hypothetical protein M5R42_15875 [Rhodocyclaceae bacterium]|nr:hypothetical protein [Rhodocyclaceae bacterium]